MQMVSDTAPLIAFSAIPSGLDILRQTVQSILVPDAVANEVIADGSGWEAAIPLQRAIESATWIEVREVGPSSLLSVLRSRLDDGESEAIALAYELSLPLLVNDSDARKAALDLGLQVTGALGLLKMAKLQGIIPCVAPQVEAMQAAGIYYADHLLVDFLRDVKEG